ncbi:MAG: protein kinase, partial [Myxococcales bacterium]|nr:protein kinase [Myxococcales bacterium]
MRDLGDELLQAQVKATLFGGDHAPRLGRLVILDRLGKGAMGTVFRAYDPVLDRTVAVKLVHAGSTTAREARALGKLHHPNVVAVHDVGELDGSVYIVMELAPGVPLRTWIAGTRTWRDVVRVMAEAAAGLAAAHRAGLVHRDVKPDNIIVGDDRTRVVDFGLASAAEDAAERGAGTPSYMAPEALDGDPATPASDQFSFGVTLYEALYGVRPHGGKTRDELAIAARTAAAAKPSRPGTADVDASADTAPASRNGGRPQLADDSHSNRDTRPVRAPPASASDESGAAPPEVDRSSGGTPRVRAGRPVRDAPPGWVHAIAVRALAAEPAKRFASMDDLGSALGRDRRRKRVLAGAIAGATIAGAVIGAIVYRHGAAPKDLCGGGAEKRERVWSAASAERVRAQLASAPWGARVVTALDDTARAWEASYRTVCEASRVKGAQSDTLLDLRMRCLDRALDRFGALAEALAAPLDPQGRVEAVGAVADLPRPAACEAISEPGELALPADPAARARATEAEHTIDRAWAAYSLGRYRDAGTALAALPETLGAPGVDAAALLLRAAVEARIGKPHTARALLEQALAAAARAHATELEAEVWARLLRHELFAGQPE